MIKNKQVNLWRGNEPPPTLYHIWFKDEELLLRYDENVADWVVFLDSKHIAEVIQEFIDAIDNISINGKPLSSNPVLDSSDILVGTDGTYIKKTDTLQLATKTLDSLLTTKVYDL